MVARRRLSLGTGQRVFLFGLGVQEHREVLADALIPLRFKVGRLRAHDAPVPFAMRDAEQFVANCATYEIDLHRVIVP